MADVLNIVTLEVRRSANTPDYPNPPWLPVVDLSRVVGVAPQHWKYDSVGQRPVSMTAGEIAAFDAAALAASKNTSIAPLDAAPTVDLLRALALVTLDEINAIRAGVALAPRTLAQMKGALQAKMG